jgi:hypothetical protein
VLAADAELDPRDGVTFFVVEHFSAPFTCC